ncbi:monovalent cation/H(+) antiporter subunit G [Micromonospora sp. DT227]|uniref:monovalent cation/H(+) antiporter subunit G n=1 Tax=Micromonospora sp. DT227 TaxID=3393433 RepID=UPI003CF95AD3
MTVDAVLDTAAGVCLIAGALLSLAAGIALVRFPDVLSRMHAAAKPQVLGLLLVLLGCALRLRTGVDITTLVLVGMFQLATAPVAAHMVGRAAYPHDDIRRDLLLTDELAGRLDRVRANRTGAAETPSSVGAPGRDA